MRVVKIFDTTLRDGEQSPGCSMNIDEKVKVAKQLEKLGVDVIEAGFAIASKGDFNAVEAIAKNIKNATVVSLARALKKDIDRAWEAVKLAKKPRIHTFIATSQIHMDYKLKMTQDQVLKQTYDMVSYAKTLCKDIEFSAEDASRSDLDFLYKVFYQAIEAGATVINVPDTVGYTMPHEYFDMITGIRENVANIHKAEISVHCHNDLGMAVANTLAAAMAGANQLECTVNGIGERAGNAALEEIVMAIKTRPDFYKVATNIKADEITKTSHLVSYITGVKVQPNKAVVGENAFAHESGIHQHGVLNNRNTYEIMTPESVGLRDNKLVLGKHSGKHAFKDKLVKMGYDLNNIDIEHCFDKFKALLDKKKEIFDEDIEIIVMGEALKIPQIITMEKFVINSGNEMTATAAITLDIEGKSSEKVACGDGPVDASYTAIKEILDIDVALEHYSISSVTSGRDAQGETTVKLGYKGSSFTGRGVDTDVIASSIKAYVNGINKIMAFEKNNGEISKINMGGIS